MNKRKLFGMKLLVLIFLCLTVMLTSCYSGKMKKYYSQKENYVNATGRVTYISYSDDGTSMYFGFSELTPKFSDNSFKIVGDNLLIAQENGIDEKIKIGDEVSFITVPRYFGDGYIMPIVEISVNGETLLEFKAGYENLQKWLR